MESGGGNGNLKNFYAGWFNHRGEVFQSLLDEGGC